MPKGHESDQQILVGRLILIWFIEIPFLALARKTSHSSKSSSSSWVNESS
jgi:hypothetical protein